MQITSLSGVQTSTPSRGAADAANSQAGIALRFEQMLWSEMLAHAGLEKALTSGGGEDVSAFSRYVIDAIAKDLALHHPLGLGADAANAQSADGS